MKRIIKKTFVVASIVALALAAAQVPAGAFFDDEQGEQGEYQHGPRGQRVCEGGQEGQGPGEEGRRGQGPCGNGSQDKRPYGPSSLMQELGLSPEQQEQMKARREQNRENHEALKTKLETARKELKTELEKETTDRARIDALIAETKALMGAQLEQRVESILTVKEILTPEQFETFQKMHKRFEKHGRGGGQYGPGSGQHGKGHGQWGHGQQQGPQHGNRDF